METENTASGREATLAEVQSRVDRGVEKLDADLGPVWVNRIDLDALNLGSSTNCVLGQLFDDYDDGVDAMWPDAPSSKPFCLGDYCCSECHGDEAEFNAELVQKRAANEQVTTRAELSASHGFVGELDADVWYDDLDTVWAATIARLRAERQEAA